MTRAKSEREQAFLPDVGDVAVPETIAQLAELVRAAEADGRAVLPAGNGAHTGTADLPKNPQLISTVALDRLETYEPDDFTVGAQAGVPLKWLREELARNGQELPVDLGAAAAGTVGGLVARAPLGPRTHRYGSVSSLLLGANGVRGGGHAWHSGGMVVKNVAGYQVGKLMAGALGHAGFVTRANFRLRPLPESRSLRVATGTPEAVTRCAHALKQSGLEPTLAILRGRLVANLRADGLPVPAGDVAVAWGFEGSEPRVKWQGAQAAHVVQGARQDLDLGPEDRNLGGRFLDFLADFAAPRGADLRDGLVRLVVLPSRLRETAADLAARIAGWRSEPAADSGEAAIGSWEDPFLGTIVLRWSSAELGDAPVAVCTEIARRHGGMAKLLSLPPDLRRRWPHELTGNENQALADRILDVFDPARGFRASRTAATVEARA